MKLTPKQEEAVGICGASKEILFYGGSRSGKTTLILLTVILRALNAPNSRHFLLRLYAASARESLFEGSLHT
jgi:phage terminase large subunit